MLSPEPFPTEFFPFAIANLAFKVSVPLCFAGWLVAYALFIRLGFKEKTFCVPIIAMCGNIGWEFTNSQLIYPKYLGIWLGQCLWLVFDALVFTTIWKYAPGEISHPMLKRWIRPLAVLGVALSSVLTLVYGLHCGDPQGTVSGWLLAFIQSIMMVGMLVQRGSSRGQSVYIALGIVVGNIAAFVWVANYPWVAGQFRNPDPIVNVALFLYTIPINLLYFFLLLRQARLDGINPWKRYW